MTNDERIDYMISSLQVAKDEIAYFGNFDGDLNKRQPNGTIIREALRSVGRMAFLVANEVVLSPYHHGLFRKD